MGKEKSKQAIGDILMIDTNRLIKMIEMNFTQKEIARRLGCSTRQLRRKIKELNIDKKNTIKPDSSTSRLEKKSAPLRITKENETALREFFCQFESGEQAAERFGITRQAILKGV